VRGEGGRGESKRHHRQRKGRGDLDHMLHSSVWDGVRASAVEKDWSRMEL